MLTPERDAIGAASPSAHCAIDANDYRNVEHTLRVFGETLMRLERGRVRLNNDWIYRQAATEGHTLGTTRMDDDPSTSVVDCDCRVHRYDNLFVAGSSVFPSGGYANPTMTIVALALRLAETLARRLIACLPSRDGPRSGLPPPEWPPSLLAPRPSDRAGAPAVPPREQAARRTPLSTTWIVTGGC